MRNSDYNFFLPLLFLTSFWNSVNGAGKCVIPYERSKRRETVSKSTVFRLLMVVKVPKLFRVEVTIIAFL